MNQTWKKLFEQKIRSRGKEYAYDSVIDYVADENGYSATVSGTENYKVEISADYQNMRCTCPYAKEGKRCKHMAAVLYYAELLEKEEKERQRKAEQKVERQRIRTVVTKAMEVLGKKGAANLLNVAEPVSEWKKEVNTLIKGFQNKDGYIGYWEADDFIANLLDCFGNLYALLSICEDKKAIDASMWLYKRIHCIGVDDSSTGCTGCFEDAMLEFWTETAEYSDKNKKLLRLALTDYEYHYGAREEMLDRLNRL